ncbi:MAG: glycosyltransferase [Planctomycetaceae bacterium]|nr:glycosyltransferase [Planctomycetaceae bacterium]
MGHTALNHNLKTLAPLPERPLVSIIVPSFNQGRFIRTTIDSVLQQAYRPLEVIVVDGGSKDDTVSVLESYGDLPELRWTSEPDKGVADAVNKGFARARGAIIGIQSSDDWYLPGAVEQAVAALQAPDRPALVYADFATVDAEGRELFQSRIGQYTLENLLSKQTWVPQPSAFFRSEVLADLNGWNPAYFVCDTEFWFRLAFRYPARKAAGLWAQRRLHDDQRNRRAQDIVSSYWRMVTESSDLQSAPGRLQRAARCGAYLTEMRYNPSGSAWQASAALWKAIAEFPSVFPAVRSLPQLLPGRLAVGALRNRVGRMLRGSSATAAGSPSQHAPTAQP